MPYVMMNFGIIVSLGLLVFVYVLTIMAVMILVKLYNLTKIQDYYKISVFALGSGGGLFVNICILLNCIGTCIAYFVILLNVTKELLIQGFETDPESWWNLISVKLAISCIFIIPFIYTKTTKLLTIPSSAMVFVGPSIILVIHKTLFFKGNNLQLFPELV